MKRLLRSVVRYVYAVGATAWSLTFGMRTPQGRSYIDRMASDFGAKQRLRPRLPTVTIAELTSDTTPVSLREPVARDGNVSLLELLVLARLVRERAPRTIFEIGTFDGRTTLNLAANAPADAVVHTLDLPASPAPALELHRWDRQFVRDDLSGIRLEGSDVESRVTRHRGDSATFDFSPYAPQFVFVDGAHSYEYVLSDTRKAMAMLDGGRGIVLWHDYGSWPGVTQALDELQAGDPEFAGLRSIEGTTLVVLER
jgi:hypothetical protein